MIPPILDTAEGRKALVFILVANLLPVTLASLARGGDAGVAWLIGAPVALVVPVAVLLSTDRRELRGAIALLGS